MSRRKMLFWLAGGSLAVALLVRNCITIEPARKIPSQPQQAESPVGRTGRGLLIPVEGISPSELSDTFTQSRDKGARPHDAIDIIAPLGTPVLAAAGGKIEKLFSSERGGNTIYVRSLDTRWIYYYAHRQLRFF